MFKQGDIVDAVYIVTKGSVRLDVSASSDAFSFIRDTLRQQFGAMGTDELYAKVPLIQCIIVTFGQVRYVLSDVVGGCSRGAHQTIRSCHAAYAAPRSAHILQPHISFVS